MKTLFNIAIVIILSSCASEEATYQADENPIKAAQASNIDINEVSFQSIDENEFGKKSDWIELYNNTSTELKLTDGDWAISDNPGKPDKFIIPETTIPPNGHLLIWCDKSDRIGSDIHANFKVSSKGETLTLYYRGNIEDQVTVDSTVSMYNSIARISRW